MKLLIQLAHYVEANCKDDMIIFLSGGFTAASRTKQTPPVSDSIRQIDPGQSGQMLVALMKYPGAVRYEVRSAPVPAGGVPGQWTNQPIANLGPASLITGLNPRTA